MLYIRFGGVFLMDTEYVYCKLCGRKLKSEKSKKLGYGITCYNKVNQVHSKKLFDGKETKYYEETKIV